MSLHTNFPHHDAMVSRHLAKRWCQLAETRLAYLTELFETGRWRRFHGEMEFLENIKEAKEAVERWRAMAAGEVGTRPLAAAPIYEAPRPAPVVSPAAVPPDVRTTPVLVPIEKLLRSAPPRDFARRTAPFHEPAPPANTDWKTALDPARIEDRYPMLRAAM